VAALPPGLPIYRRVVLHARPPRLATVFFGGDAWEATVQRLLEGYTRIWGGAGDVIVPFSERGEVHPALWRVLKRYDADRWAYYAVTRHGQRMARPEAFSAWLDEQASAWVEEHGGTMDEAREMLTSDHIIRQPLTDAPEGLAQRIRREMAPDARREDHVFTTCFMADAEPGPRVGSACVMGAGRLRLPAVSEFPVHPQLLVRARTGDLAPSHRRALVEAGVDIEETPVPISQLSMLLGLAWNSDASDSHGMRLLRNVTEQQVEAPAIADDAYIATTPLANTVAGCGLYHVWHPDWDERPFMVIAGETADDFALALALDRCYSAAAWWPTTLSGDYAKVAAGELTRTLNHATRRVERRVLLTSTSLSERELAEVAQTLTAQTWGSELSFEIVDAVTLPLLPAQRLFERHGFGREEHVLPFIDDVLAGQLPPVIPSGPETPPPESLTWQIDADIEGFSIPPRWCLNETVEYAPGWYEANMRAGSDGVSYMSTRMGFVAAGSTLEQTVARPRLRLATASQMVELLANAAGLTATHSAAGRFTGAMIDLFGGLEASATALRNPATSATLEGYLSNAGSGTDPGVFLETVSRRFLTLDDVTRLGSTTAEQARATLDELLTKRVLDRGLVLACGRCRHAAFYRIAELDRTFTCNRCNSTADIVQQRWKIPVEEPAWYYALDEVVFQALRHDGWDIVHTLSRLQEHTRAFLWSPQTEMREGNRLVGELDVLVVADGRLIVGEAKRGDRLEDTAQAERQLVGRLIGLAVALTADTLVLASRTNWSQRTRNGVADAARSTDMDVRFLEGVGA
jgi:hypothetical protein